MKKLIQIWNNKDLRYKILFTLFGILVYRFAASVSVPGVDTEAVKVVFEQNQILGVFSAFTGGSSENFSIMLMGISPYINASIILQLMTVVIPKLEALSKEGEAGRRTINRWTRYLTLPLALLQSYGMILLLNNSAAQAGTTLIADVYNPMVVVPLMLSITVGTVFLMWLGEIITERGISNGISLIIFAGIVANVPSIVGQTLGLAIYDETKYLPFILITIVTLLLTMFVVLIAEGYRNIPITYSGQANRGINKGGLPIKVNQAGMIPIIFAVSVITFPSLVAQFFRGHPAADWILNNFGGNQLSGVYIASLFIFVIAFTYFYVSITFNPEEVAENIQKRGGYIPGVRPGKETTQYLANVSDRLNLWGGVFIGGLASGPILLQRVFQDMNFGTVQLLMSGSGIIIIVGVVTELVRQVNTQLMQEDYDKYMKTEG
ncbi:MAG: preprotein translocase subunit SecY [Candidatus Gracilibacteria bacterium]|nr:preprotein translocase subunit SecY [Candidatus Gracilibacteria bacterium]